MIFNNFLTPIQIRLV